MTAQNMPAAEFDVTDDLVRRLIADQHPDLADRSLALVANGWDNVIFRLGGDLVVRLPRRQLGADLVLNEQRWLPGLVGRLPIPIAAPVRTGGPAFGYPWAWSICAWFDGEVAADTSLADPTLEAQRLGGFVAALHGVPAADAPENPHRGQPIDELRGRVETNIARLGRVIDTDTIGRHAAQLCDVDDWVGEPVLLHGDLHSANLIVSGGAIAAVLDFGDITSGDPACDLAVAWMLFGDADREVFRLAAGGDAEAIDDATWQRGRAWALHFSLLYLLHSADSERFQRMGDALVRAVLER